MESTTIKTGACKVPVSGGKMAKQSNNETRSQRNKTDEKHSHRHR
jgi:hypothetical protein